MKKLVPDPPLITTTHHPFSPSPTTKAPLFAVCDGVEIGHALAQLAGLLRLSWDSNYLACETAETNSGMSELLWSTQHVLKMSQALVDSLLAGVARQQAAR